MPDRIDQEALAERPLSSPPAVQMLNPSLKVFDHTRPGAESEGTADSSVFPKALVVSVRIVNDFTNRRKRTELSRRGILIQESESPQHILAPIVRDPRTSHPWSIHARSMSTPTIPAIVAKGVGLDVPENNGQLFGYNATLQPASQRYRGMEIIEVSEEAARIAIAFHRGYKENSRNSAIRTAKLRYDIRKSPFYTPLLILQPLRLPYMENNHLNLLERNDALQRCGLPDYYQAQQGILLYEVPMNERLNEPLSDDLLKKLHVVYSTTDPTTIALRFTARLAVGLHLAHNILGFSFSGENEEIPGTYYSSLDISNVTYSGHIMDLGIVHDSSDTDNLSENQIIDRQWCLDTIRHMAERLSIAPAIVLPAFYDIYFADLPLDVSNDFKRAFVEWQEVFFSQDTNVLFKLVGIGNTVGQIAAIVRELRSAILKDTNARNPTLRFQFLEKIQRLANLMDSTERRNQLLILKSHVDILINFLRMKRTSFPDIDALSSSDQPVQFQSLLSIIDRMQHSQAENYFRTAEAHLTKGHLAQARAEFAMAAAVDSKWAAPARELGNTYIAEGNDAMAAYYYQMASDREEAFPEANGPHRNHSPFLHNA